jgi:uncharacterized protein (TIGR02145 family)
VAKALELYFNDTNSYPSIITFGQALKSPDGSVTYFDKLPTNPTPRTDNGSPNSEYIYSATSSGKEYNMSAWVGSYSGSSVATPIFVSSLSPSVSACGAGLIVDQDGYSYPTVQIGTQCWMAQDLRTKTNPDGTCIVGGSALCPDAAISDSGLARRCRGATNVEANCALYGASYNWAGAMNGSVTAGAQGICPNGWHIPTHDEMTTLERAVCTSGTCATDFPYDNVMTGYRGTNEATKLKTAGSSGFNGIIYSGSVTFWTSSRPSGPWIFYRLFTSLATPFRSIDTAASFYQVRCVKN